MIGISEKVPCLVIYHDPAVEGMELEIAILPPLLLPLDVLCIEATKFCHGRAVLGGGDRGYG